MRYVRCDWDDWLERARQAEASKPKPPVPPKRVMHQGREMDQYQWFDSVPEHLKTKTQLGKLGLKPGGEPVAFIYWRRRKATYYLYDVTQAAPKRQMSEAQAAALAKAQEAQRIKHQTCEHCGEVDPSTERTFLDPDEDIYPTGPRWCRHCRGLDEAIRNLSEEVGFTSDRAEAVEEARKILASDPAGWCMLDTETTGLDWTAQVVQIGVLAPDGTVLLDTLVRPTCEVTEGARAVHGISDEALRNAPSFYAVYPELMRVVRRKKVIAYNAAFDRDILAHCCDLYDLSDLPVQRWWCAMLWYAPYAGEWSERHGDYKWQPLGGDHDAVGDCRKVLELLQRVAYDQNALDYHERMEQSLHDLERQWDERASK
jgi:DNA polymerase-3 subunit epsilon